MRAYSRTLRLMATGLSAAVAVAVGARTAIAAEKPPTVGDKAKDFELTGLGGDKDGSVAKVKLSQQLDAGPVVLVVLRGYPGYQCPLCTRQVAELAKKADDFKKAGAKVLLVYPGPADDLKAHADEFVKGKDYPAHFQFLLDPDYTFANSYGLRWDAKNETAYPSTFVLDKDGKVLFAKVSKTHGDRAKVADVLGALPAK